MPEIFRARTKANSPRTLKPREPFRERGYTPRWDRFSRDYRRRKPLCRFCEQEDGRVVLCNLVDHIIPVVDRPDLLLDPSNVQGLCTSHHGLKTWLEAEARARGNLDLLVTWCADPSTRPRRRGDVPVLGHDGTPDRVGGCD